MFCSSLLKSFTSLVKLIPRYFIIFDAMVNKNVFVISSSYCSHIEMQLICVLTLYPATLQNSFLNFNRLFVFFFGGTFWVFYI